MAITFTDDSATITSTERFLASDSTTATYQTADCVLQVFLDLSNLAGGDTFVITFYEKVDGTNARAFASTTFTNAQTPANWASSQYIVGAGWEVGLDKTAGADRVIAWSLRTIS
jgi:hypothetical protein